MDCKKLLKNVAKQNNKDIEDLTNTAQAIANGYNAAASGFIKEIENGGYIAPDYILEKAKILEDSELIKIAEEYQKVYWEKKKAEEKELKGE